MTELHSCHTDCVAREAWNIYSVAFTEKVCQSPLYAVILLFILPHYIHAAPGGGAVSFEPHKTVHWNWLVHLYLYFSMDWNVSIHWNVGKIFSIFKYWKVFQYLKYGHSNLLSLVLKQIPRKGLLLNVLNWSVNCDGEAKGTRKLTWHKERQPASFSSHCLRKRNFSRPERALYLDSGLPSKLPFPLDSFPASIPHCQMDTVSGCLRKLISTECIYEIKLVSRTCMYLLNKEFLKYCISSL